MAELRALTKGQDLDPRGELELGVSGDLERPASQVGRFSIVVTTAAARKEPLAGQSTEALLDALKDLAETVLGSRGNGSPRHDARFLKENGFSLGDDIVSGKRRKAWVRVLAWPETNSLVQFLEKDALRLTSLTAEQWKSFGATQTIPLSRLTLLIGPNNAGKSNVLHIIPTICRYLQGPNSLLAPQELDANLPRQDAAPRLGLRFKLGGHECALHVGWTSRGEFTEWLNLPEQVYLRTGDKIESRLFKTSGTIQQNQSGLTWALGYAYSSMPQLYGAITELQNALTAYAVWRLNVAAMDQPGSVVRVAALQPSGAGAPALLDHLRDRYPDRYESLQQDVRRCAPEIDRVVAEATDKPGTKEIVFYEVSGRAIRCAHASEGLKFLLYVVLLVHSPTRSPILGLEEVEHGMHPARIADVVGFLRRLTSLPRGPQLVLTSHSPLVVDQFRDNPQDVVVVERDDNGHTVCTSLGPRFLELPEAGRETALGDLWYAGVLGGTPKS